MMLVVLLNCELHSIHRNPKLRPVRRACIHATHSSSEALRRALQFMHESQFLVAEQKKIEVHKIGLVGQAPSRRGDPRKPLAGPNGQKIARLAGMSYDELIACRRKQLNTHYSGKRSKGDAFDQAKGNVNAADILLDWRVERIVLLGKNVARCFGFRDLPFLAEIRVYG